MNASVQMWNPYMLEDFPGVLTPKGIDPWTTPTGTDLFPYVEWRAPRGY